MPSRRKLKHLRRKLTRSNVLMKILGGCASLFIRIYVKTLRITVTCHKGIGDDNISLQNLYAFWHGQQFLLLAAGRRGKMAIMTDISFAGDVQTNILQHFGYFVVRGSSKHKPARALLAIKCAIDQGYAGAFAVDGPNGPNRKAKSGIIYLSGKHGLPIIPVTTMADRYWTLNSTWCQYQIPKPFARCLIQYGQPLEPKQLANGKWEATIDEQGLTEALNQQENSARRCFS